jgi:hypothetical protein
VSGVSLEGLPVEVFQKYLCRHLIKSSIVESLKDIETEQKDEKIESFYHNRKEFLPFVGFVSQDAEKRAINQNGVKINFKQKKIYFNSFSSLLLVSHKMQKMYEDALKTNYQYWFKKRATLNMFSECYFKYNIKSREQEDAFLLIDDIVQTPYLKMRKKNLEKRTYYYSLFLYWDKYFFTMPDFFIACSARKLLSLYSFHEENKNPPEALCHILFSVFFNEKDAGPPNNDLNKRFIFLIALSLGLLMPNSPKKDLQAIHKDFSALKNLFNILSSNTPFIEEQKMLDSLNNFYLKTIISDFKNDFNKKQDYDCILLLQSIEKMAHYFFGFETLLTKYYQEYYKKFSDEKKLFFIYCMLKSNRDLCLNKFFSNGYNVSYSILNLLYVKIEAHFEFRKNSFNICDNKFEKCKSLNLLLSLLLSQNEITTCCYYLNFYPEVDEKINRLFSLYLQMSYHCLAQNFSLFLDPKWEDRFKEIMESFVLPNNSSSISTGNLFFEAQELEKEIKDKQEQKSALDYQKRTLEATIVKLRNEYCIVNEKKGELNLEIEVIQKKIETLKTEEKNQNVLFLNNKDIQDKKIKSLEMEIEAFKQKIGLQRSLFKKLFSCFLLMGSAVFLSSLYLWSISAKTI